MYSYAFYVEVAAPSRHAAETLLTSDLVTRRGGPGQSPVTVSSYSQHLVGAIEERGELQALVALQGFLGPLRASWDHSGDADDVEHDLQELENAITGRIAELEQS